MLVYCITSVVSLQYKIEAVISSDVLHPNHEHRWQNVVGSLTMNNEVVGTIMCNRNLESSQL